MTAAPPTRHRLTGVDGLGQLRQLTTLHLRENRVASLDGFSPSMEALQYLNLRYHGNLTQWPTMSLDYSMLCSRSNSVSELSEVGKLGCLPMLRALILAECAISEGDDYRLEVLVCLPRLERLDKDPFTEEERADAEEVCAVSVCLFSGVYISYHELQVSQQRQEGGDGEDES